MRQELLILLPLRYVHYLLCSEFWQKSSFMKSLIYPPLHPDTHTHTNYVQKKRSPHRCSEIYTLDNISKLTICIDLKRSSSYILEGERSLNLEFVIL